MPRFCEYGMCHNLGSSTYLGYCNEYHMKRAFEKEKLMKILESNPHVSTLKDARKVLTSSSHCEGYTEPPRESDACPKASGQ
jgi:hypothetical protein